MGGNIFPLGDDNFDDNGEQDSNYSNEDDDSHAPVAYCLVHYQPATTKVSEVALTKLKADWLDNVCGDIYIMMKCLFVCHEKSSLPPGSLL